LRQKDRAPLSCARAFGRAEEMLFFLYPALIPQRASAPSETWPGYYHASLAGLGLFSFSRRCLCRAHAGCGSEGAYYHPSLRDRCI